MNITHVTFEPFIEQDDERLAFAVMMARYDNKWVFVKHKERDTYEIPGGRRESGEPILETAKREFFEETGAIDFELQPLEIYKVHFADRESSYGLLCYVHVETFGALPESEIEQVCFFEQCPTLLTYPQIQPSLFKRITIYQNLYKL